MALFTTADLPATMRLDPEEFAARGSSTACQRPDCRTCAARQPVPAGHAETSY